MNAKTVHIKEYESFISGKDIPGYIKLEESVFNTLENFILTYHNNDTDALELMGISYKKDIGKVITAKNYVGVITLNNGTVIEILPKIYSALKDDQQAGKTKQVLINMLKTLQEMPFKAIQTSHISIEKINIFEIFIKMFVDEVFFIVKRGLKCNYETIQENTALFKGKMLFSKQIQFNSCHKERNYCEYDSFTSNRPENRLLKAALLYLYKKTTSSKNKNNIKILLNSFEHVETSMDYTSDFTKCIADQNMKDYRTALLWCQVFLAGKSFASFSGSGVALALLFPMEILFESYIASLLKKQIGKTNFTISIQDKTHYLFDNPRKKFLLKPDIVVRHKSDKCTFVLDTKWKILDKNKTNYGITQADMYQMFAYQTKYKAKNVTLLYPKTENMQANNDINFLANDGTAVHVQFIDLFNVKNSIEEIINNFDRIA